MGLHTFIGQYHIIMIYSISITTEFQMRQQNHLTQK